MCLIFQLICNQTPRFTIGDCAAGHRADNRDKNRNVLIVPREYNKHSQYNLAIRLSPSWQLPAVHHIIPRKQLHGLHQCCVCRCEYELSASVRVVRMVVMLLPQGYTHPREYIVTEWPVVSTCSDLWSLVYDHDCSAVVVLCNPSPGVSNVSPAQIWWRELWLTDCYFQSYPSFWPENQKSKKYGQVFTVEYVSHNHYPNIRYSEAECPLTSEDNTQT